MFPALAAAALAAIFAVPVQQSLVRLHAVDVAVIAIQRLKQLSQRTRTGDGFVKLSNLGPIAAHSIGSFEPPNDHSNKWREGESASGVSSRYRIQALEEWPAEHFCPNSLLNAFGTIFPQPLIHETGKDVSIARPSAGSCAQAIAEVFSGPLRPSPPWTRSDGDSHASGSPESLPLRPPPPTNRGGRAQGVTPQSDQIRCRGYETAARWL